MHVTTFIVRGCKSSHPAALFLELHAILHISSSANTDAKKNLKDFWYIHSSIL